MLPRPLAGFKGPTSKGRERKRTGGKGKGGDKGEDRVREGRGEGWRKRRGGRGGEGRGGKEGEGKRTSERSPSSKSATTPLFTGNY